jgi:signal transduction histidine kinase
VSRTAPTSDAQPAWSGSVDSVDKTVDKTAQALRRRSTWPGWLAIAPALALAIGIRLGLHDFVGGEVSFLLYLSVVTLCSVLGGFWPGLVATLLAGLVNLYFFIPPYYSLHLASRESMLRLMLFVFEGTLISFLGDRLLRLLQRAERSEAEARELEQHILEVADAERRRIGHDLHDEIGQQLLAVALQAKGLARQVKDVSPALEQRAEQVASVANEALSSARRMARSLSAITAVADDISSALADLAAGARQHMNVQAELTIAPDAPLLRGTSGEHLFRITQEAISNAVRHGKATAIQIRVKPTASGGGILEVEDNGIGIAPAFLDDGAGRSKSGSGPKSPGGMGLRVMRYRAEVIGANLAIARGVQGGTLIACRYPAPAGPANPGLPTAQPPSPLTP